MNRFEEDLTKRGFTGLAMMHVNDTDTYEILSYLNDWLSILEACNENTEYYKELGLEQESWYGENNQVNTVFDPEEYYNPLTNQTRAKWFNTTLVKLLFYNLSTSMSNAKTQLEAYYAEKLTGSEEYSMDALIDDDGNYWLDYIPMNGQYNFNHFDLVFETINQLLRVYQVIP